MVGRGSAYDLYLSRELRAAQLLRTPTSQTVVDRFLAENADVAAGVRQQLEADAERLGGAQQPHRRALHWWPGPIHGLHLFEALPWHQRGSLLSLRCAPGLR